MQEPPNKKGARSPRTELPIGTDISANVRRLRTRRGLSLQRFAMLSGVSRAMIGQIERGRSSPSINILWKIARALDVRFSALLGASTGSEAVVLRAADASAMASKDGAMRSRPLFPLGEGHRRVEFYELRLAADSVEHAAARVQGTSENVTLVRGALEVDLDGVNHRLDPGDSVLFEADKPHVYRNPGRIESLMYLLISHGPRATRRTSVNRERGARARPRTPSHTSHA